MLYVKGDRVRFLGKPEWGPGRVLNNSEDGKARVFFTEAGVKILVLKYAKLMRVTIRPPPDAPPAPFD